MEKVINEINLIAEEALKNRKKETILTAYRAIMSMQQLYEEIPGELGICIKDAINAALDRLGRANTELDLLV